MNELQPKTLIFDLDGTIIDSSSSVQASLAYALSKHNLYHSDILDSCLIGPPLHDLIASAVPDKDPIVISLVKETFISHYDSTCIHTCQLYPQALYTLQTLHDHGHSLYVCTNKRLQPTLLLLKHFNLLELFDQVVCSDSRQEPFASKAEALRYLLDVSPINTQQSFYIGDTYSDMVASQDVGLLFVWASWGYYETSRYNELSSATTLTSLCYLIDLFTI